jgi:hypothetical protein
MSFDFPRFDEPSPIAPDRNWTARYHGYDERHDDVYYLVIVSDGDRELTRSTVQVGVAWAGDDWTRADFIERLRQQLQTLAATLR